MATLRLCPKCSGYIPNNTQPGEFPGAISRVNGEEICSKCGMEEAVGPSLTQTLLSAAREALLVEGMREFAGDLADLEEAEKIGAVKTCLHDEWRWLDCAECADSGETCDEKVCVDCGASVS